MSTYTDENGNLSLSETIDREIIHAMDTVCNKLGGWLSKLPKESVEPLFILLGNRGDKTIEDACEQVIEVLGYSTEELPLHVNDGGIVETTTVWRLRHGI